MAKVIVYTTDYCPYCRQAKALLTRRGVAFEEVHMDRENEAEWQAMIEKSGMRTVPQIWLGEKLIGGYSELSGLDLQDQLASLKN